MELGSGGVGAYRPELESAFLNRGRDTAAGTREYFPAQFFQALRPLHSLNGGIEELCTSTHWYTLQKASEKPNVVLGKSLNLFRHVKRVLTRSESTKCWEANTKPWRGKQSKTHHLGEWQPAPSLAPPLPLAPLSLVKSTCSPLLPELELSSVAFVYVCFCSTQQLHHRVSDDPLCPLTKAVRALLSEKMVVLYSCQGKEEHELLFQTQPREFFFFLHKTFPYPCSMGLCVHSFKLTFHGWRHLFLIILKLIMTNGTESD